MNKNYFKGDLIPAILIILLIISIGLSWYSVWELIRTVLHGFRINLLGLTLSADSLKVRDYHWALLLLVLVGLPYLLFSGRRLKIGHAGWPLIVLGLMAISSLFSIKPAASFKETLYWVEVFTAYFLTLNLVRRPGEAKAVLVAVILTGMVQTVWGMKLLSDTGFAESMITPYLSHPNVLSFYLDLSLPAALAFLIGMRGMAWKTLGGICSLVIAMGLGLTRARGASLSNGFVICLFFLIFLYQRTGKELYLNVLKKLVSYSFLGLIFLFGCFFLLVVFAPGLTEILLRKTEPLTIISGRLYYYVTGCQIIEDFPLLGVGGGLFKDVSRYYIPFYAPQAYIEVLKRFHLHNLYLRLAAEYGLLTFWAFLLFLYRTAKDGACRSLLQKGDKGWLMAGAGGSAMAWLLHHVVDEAFSVTAIQFGILLGLFTALKGYAGEDSR